MSEIKTWSVTAPVANWLLAMSNLTVARHRVPQTAELSVMERTKRSGFQDVPFKTVFPSWCRLVLNKYSMWPICALQRRYYDTDRGLAIMASGNVSPSSL